jgi:hypothetical protein
VARQRAWGETPRTNVLELVVPLIVAAVIFGKYHVVQRRPQVLARHPSKTCRLRMTAALITYLNMCRRGGAPLRRGMHLQLGAHCLVF